MDAQPEQPSRNWFSLARLRSINLFRREGVPLSAWETIGWWEARRVPYNLIVGLAGLLSCLAILTLGLSAVLLFNQSFDMGSPFVGPFLILVFAVMANLCYTGGWLVELLVRKWWPGEANHFATTTFALGTLFSILLTLLPGIAAVAVALLALARHLSK